MCNPSAAALAQRLCTDGVDIAQVKLSDRIMAKKGAAVRAQRVHDTDNVYVCSNAVFPNTGVVNPTLTLVALPLDDSLSGSKPGSAVA